MGTRNNPGAYDCFHAAEPDEPMFTLLARDPTAEYFVAAWAAVRAGDIDTARSMMDRALFALKESGKPELPYDSPKSVEAQQCSKAMRSWRLGRQIESIEKRLAGG